MNEIIGFLAGSALLLWFSRKALRAAGSHGFYRFFAWEAILLLVVLNHEPWGENPWSPQQVASWILMLLSILLASLGLGALRSDGQAGEQRDDPALYGFEKTTALVTSGVFRYIRHPMYTSLIALAWGAFFQDPSLIGSVVALSASFFLLLTARADEQECLQYFGEQYANYRQRTWMFIPFLL
jgi:protein-S-isoprenylcysteine O-methyltransferase Ste14